MLNLDVIADPVVIPFDGDVWSDVWPVVLAIAAVVIVTIVLIVIKKRKK